MNKNHSVNFFDAQFRKQTQEHDFRLNPFELAALPHLRGRVLDFGCGMGNLAFAAAERGCSVLAFDASTTAVTHIQQRAEAESQPVQAALADLRNYEIDGEFDAVVSIGLLMFFDCPSALKTLDSLKAHVKEGGIAAVNVLIEGTTYLDMFDPDDHCLLSRGEMESRFAGWHILRSEVSEFDAPGATRKVFVTVIAQKPQRHPPGDDRS